MIHVLCLNEILKKKKIGSSRDRGENYSVKSRSIVEAAAVVEVVIVVVVMVAAAAD